MAEIHALNIKNNRVIIFCFKIIDIFNTNWRYRIRITQKTRGLTVLLFGSYLI